jgi:hypothetical protein
VAPVNRVATVDSSCTVRTGPIARSRDTATG